MSGLPEELPRLWQKPDFEELLDYLNKLQVKPPVWRSNQSRVDVLSEQNAVFRDRREVNRFISAVVSSSLAWIDNDDQREALWTMASRRLAERCGRTGTPKHGSHHQTTRDGD